MPAVAHLSAPSLPFAPAPAAIASPFRALVKPKTPSVYGLSAERGGYFQQAIESTPLMTANLKRRRRSLTRVKATEDSSVKSGVMPKFGGDSIGTKVVLGLAWSLYMWFVVIHDSAQGKPTSELLIEATELSVNFWFVTPTLFPQLAPVISPALEGLFEFLVTWSVLYFGFISEGRNQKAVNSLAFFIGSAFLTNIFYIPYLAIREASPDLLPPPEGHSDTPNAKLEEYVENKFFGPVVGGMGLISILWALFARPEFGGLADRANELGNIIKNDKLASSFVADIGIFSILQSWMVPDDMKRRNFDDKKALWAARLIPMFGLAYYMAVRPPLDLEKED